jgi:hypothetical protein
MAILSSFRQLIRFVSSYRPARCFMPNNRTFPHSSGHSTPSVPFILFPYELRVSFSPSHPQCPFEHGSHRNMYDVPLVFPSIPLLDFTGKGLITTMASSAYCTFFPFLGFPCQGVYSFRYSTSEVKLLRLLLKRPS